MAKKLYIFSVLIALILLIACQESPESDIIVNKNEDKLEQAIKEENTEEPEEETWIREHKEDSFETTTGDTTVVVDAEVKSVDAPMPVIRVTPHEINSDELKAWAGGVIENETWYDPGAPKSRKVLEQEILEWKEMESHLEEEREGESLELAKKEYEESIKNLEKAYEQAGDNGRARTESDFVFRPAQYYMDESAVISEDDKLAKDMQFQAVTEYKNGISWKLSSTNRNETDYGMHTLSCYVYDKDEKQHPHVKCTTKEARQVAEGILERLGIRNKVAVVLVPFFILLLVDYIDANFLMRGEYSPIKFLQALPVANDCYGWAVLLIAIVIFAGTFGVLLYERKHYEVL